MNAALEKIPADHKKRVITGLALFASLVLVMFIGSWPLTAFAGLASAIGLWEFYSLFWPGISRLPEKILGMLFGLGVVLCAMFDKPWLMLGILSGTFLIGSIMFLFKYGCRDTAQRPEPYYVLSAGILYVPMSLQIALHLGWRQQILAIFAAFISDIGGYYLGCLFGKRKIWPTISPKKTWAGSIGGLTVCALGSALLCFLLAPGELAGGLKDKIFSSLPHCLGLGLTLGMAAQLGDFFESALKRVLGVKDSSNLLPGHGGLLDRIDSLLFTLPALLVYNYFMPIF